MIKRFNRRKLLTGAGVAAAGGLFLNGFDRSYLPPTYGSLTGIGEALTFAGSRFFMGQRLAPEYPVSAITPRMFAPFGPDHHPEAPDYLEHRAGRFANWKLPVEGRVARPTQFSLADLRQFPSRTQVVMMNCVAGWAQIQPFTGVPLSEILAYVGLSPSVRYIVYEAYDGFWQSIDMMEALHPQTLLTYEELPGTPLGPWKGLPLRLSVPRHIGYKQLRWLKRIEAIDDLTNYRDGTGSSHAAMGYSWYVGPA